MCQCKYIDFSTFILLQYIAELPNAVANMLLWPLIYYYTFTTGGTLLQHSFIISLLYVNMLDCFLTEPDPRFKIGADPSIFSQFLGNRFYQIFSQEEQAPTDFSSPNNC